MGSAMSTPGYQATPKTYFSSRPAYVPLRQAVALSENTSLRILLELNCPSLQSEFHPAWWLFNGHLQSVYGIGCDSESVTYDRRLLRTKDGGTLGIDFTAIASESPIPDEAPIIVVIPGINGGSRASYIRSILAPAILPIEHGGLGYRGVVVNYRGGPGIPLTSPRFYSACQTDDLQQALLYISHCYPRAPLLGLGFSLGANILTRYVAEEGEECRLASACVLGCPWDLNANTDALHERWFHRHVYAKGMGRDIRRRVLRHADSIMKFPDSRLAQCLPALSSQASLTYQQFDDLVTVHAGDTSPPFPFESSRDYYAHASSHKVLGDVRIPFLAVNADDDPVVKHLPVDETDNEWVVMVVTRGGGHLGWFETTGIVETRRWITQPALEWFRATAEKIDVSRGRVMRDIHLVDGWLVESGREHLGFREIGRLHRII